MSTTIFAANPIAAPDVAGLMTEAALAQGHEMYINEANIRDIHRHSTERFTEYKLEGTIVPADTDQPFRFEAKIAATYQAARDNSAKAVLVNQGIEVFDIDGIRHMPHAQGHPSSVEGFVKFIICNTEK